MIAKSASQWWRDSDTVFFVFARLLFARLCFACSLSFCLFKRASINFCPLPCVSHQTLDQRTSISEHAGRRRARIFLMSARQQCSLPLDISNS